MGIAGDIILITVAALVGGVAAHVLRMPVLLGYIVAGIFVGPHTIGPTVVKVHDIEVLADIGVALLLFAVGLEFPIWRLAPVKNIALVGTPIQMVVTAAFGAGLVTLLGWGWNSALWFGCLVSVSSTMVVLKFLGDRGLMDTLSARVMTAMLIVQDLAVIPMMILLPALGELSEGMSALGGTLVRSAAFVAAMLVAGKKVLPWIMARVAAWQSRELFMVTVMALGLGIGYTTYLTGLSFAFGAFLAGVVLTESDYSHQALSEIVPFRDLFSMIFFVSVGMLISPRFLWEAAGSILFLTAAVFLFKAVLLAAVVRGFGYGNIMPLAVGLGMGQVGEFSIVLARLGHDAGALAEDAYLTLLTLAAVSMALTPFAARGAAPLYAWWRGRRGWEPMQTMAIPQAPLTGHVVVAGYGRVGRFLAGVLRRLDREVAVIELNPEKVQEARQAGLHVLGGDTASEEVLEGAGVARAELVVLTAPDAVATLGAVEKVRKLNPGVRILARAVSLEHHQDLTREGVFEAPIPEMEAGLELLRQSLLQLGMGGGEILACEDRIRREGYASMAAPGGDLAAAVQDLRRSAREIGMAWHPLPAGSPLDGCSLAESAVRKTTGASILAVVRDEGLLTELGPDFILRGGDLVAAAGTPAQIRAYEALAKGEPGASGRPASQIEDLPPGVPPN